MTLRPWLTHRDFRLQTGRGSQSHRLAITMDVMATIDIGSRTGPPLEGTVRFRMGNRKVQDGAA